MKFFLLRLLRLGQHGTIEAALDEIGRIDRYLARHVLLSARSQARLIRRFRRLSVHPSLRPDGQLPLRLTFVQVLIARCVSELETPRLEVKTYPFTTVPRLQKHLEQLRHEIQAFVATHSDAAALAPNQERHVEVPIWPAPELRNSARKA